MNSGLVTSVNVDTNQTDKLLRLLDTVVIKLEGGTEEDLKVLDEKPNIEQRPEPIKESLSVSAAGNAAATAATAVTKANALITASEPKSDDGAINENDDDSNDVKEVEPIEPVETNADDKVGATDEKPSKKRKRTTSGSSSSSSSSTSSSGN